MIYYDLHIHSCLSPCANDDMTANNIVNMALIKGLNLISVCDHNSLLMQRTLAKVAHQKGLAYLYGVELQTIEDVHCLVYFTNDEYLDEFQNYIDEHLIKMVNIPEYFGNQLIRDENDEVISCQKNLLITSLDISINDLAKEIRKYEALMVLAHINGRKNSILTQLGFIPSDLEFDGVEITDLSLDDKVYQQIKFKPIFKSSDAHTLEAINEAINYIDLKELALYDARFSDAFTRVINECRCAQS